MQNCVCAIVNICKYSLKALGRKAFVLVNNLVESVDNFDLISKTCGKLNAKFLHNSDIIYRIIQISNYYCNFVLDLS